MNEGGQNRGQRQSWKQPGPPWAPVVVYQSNQQQPNGSGQKGQGQGNQRRPRVTILTTQDDSWMAGLEDKEAAQHAAGIGTDASLHQG